jgi:5,10-methylene-tetrahydrofolate dehydrogenase/methenyl tetrahydrofolate cyclohydrolase
MAVEVSTTGFSSNLLVEEMTWDTARMLAEQLPEGQTAGAAFIMTGPDNASASYGIEALDQAVSTDGLHATVYVPIEGSEHIPYKYRKGEFPAQHFRAVTDPEEMRQIRREGRYYQPNAGATIGLTRWLNADEHTDAIVPLLPAATAELDAEVRNTVSKRKDVDGTAPNPWYTPTTPEGMVELAEHIIANLPEDHPLRLRGVTCLQDLKPEELAVFGYGLVVGKPLVEDVLPAHDRPIAEENVFRDRAEIEAGIAQLALGRIAVAFTGFRAAGTIRTAAPGTILVDVGNALDDSGRAMGNVHPDLVAQSGIDGRVVTKFIGGGGRVTIAIVMRRTAENKIENYERSQLPQPGLRDKVRGAIAALFPKLPTVEQLN